MFAKLSVLLVSVTAVLGASIVKRDCDTGTVQCCDSIAPSKSVNWEALAGILPIGLANTNVPIGVNCNPISVIGGGVGSSCSSTPACCTGTTSGPLTAGCSPIVLG